MKPKYTEEKGYSGRIYQRFNCGNCNVLLAENENDLPNYCSNCGTKVNKLQIKEAKHD